LFVMVKIYLIPGAGLSRKRPNFETRVKNRRFVSADVERREILSSNQLTFYQFYAIIASFVAPSERSAVAGHSAGPRSGAKRERDAAGAPACRRKRVPRPARSSDKPE